MCPSPFRSTELGGTGIPELPLRAERGLEGKDMGGGGERNRAGLESPAVKEGLLGLLEMTQPGDANRVEAKHRGWLPYGQQRGVRGGWVICYGTLPSPYLHRTEWSIKGQEGASPQPCSKLCLLQGHPARPYRRRGDSKVWMIFPLCWAPFKVLFLYFSKYRE